MLYGCPSISIESQRKSTILRVYSLEPIINLSSRSIRISDSGNIDELRLRRQRRADKRASIKDDGDLPQTKFDSDRGGSGRRPRRKKTAVGTTNPLRDREVRLIGEDGMPLGIVTTREALRIAKEKGLNLFILQPDANPPVARIMNFGRFKFEQEKKTRETKRKHHIVDVKEIKMRYKIEEHDYQIKLKHAQNFLGEGDKVKVLMILQGREMQHKELAQNLMHRFADELKEIAVVDQQPEMEGKSVLMILAPCPR